MPHLLDATSIQLSSHMPDIKQGSTVMTGVSQAVKEELRMTCGVSSLGKSQAIFMLLSC